MNRTSKITVAVTSLVLLLTLAVGPAAATEAGGEGEAQKVELASNQHEFVGLFILGALGLGAVLAVDNARRQLRGERKQASGEFRWR